ncbi:EKC/KEOPS complex subunit Lage3-like [Liolophura sinensis]|uniref:EKC/KEOPS complex subunit Lage3-like n=1 Tax=Liolophura sinensis TaxID=3198878 RepID=UPI0031594ADD
MANDHIVDLRVPFPDVRQAEIACNTLSVDQEPRRGGATKTINTEGNILCLKICAAEAKVLRVSLNSFLDHLALVVETIDQFGPPT